MFHVDGQQVAALSIVLAASVVLGRRAVSQIKDFRGRGPSDPACGGCGGCGAATEPKQPKLEQIQLQAPQRVRRSEVE